MAEFIYRHWMFFLVIQSTFSLLLSFQRKQILLNIGKSIGCGALFLLSWSVFYFGVYGYIYNEVLGFIVRLPLLSISDVWRWFPATIYLCIFIICLIVIWKPFSDRSIMKCVLGIAGIMVILTVAAVLSWEDVTHTRNASPGLRVVSDESIFAELWRILRESALDIRIDTELHIVALFFAFTTFLSYKKNQIVARIGKSMLSAVLILFIPWGWITWRFMHEWQRWGASIVCIGIFLAVLFFIWKPSIAKRQASS